jgi:DNA (cytosine-5)-methyltransferase 1
MAKKIKQIQVVELFAGVGGFRLGLEKASSNYKIVWSNQWEPSNKIQTASHIYVKKFGLENHSNQDISTIPSEKIPNHDLLVGGFPCQDYSVARTLNKSAGLEGKKGVLWWEIHRILNEKVNKPKYLFFENVDRLIKSPAKQRGRDFAIMLSSLSHLGYAVEWRVLNAADYGMPQRRRRIFFLGYHKTSNLYKELMSNPLKWIKQDGVLASTFIVSSSELETPQTFEIDTDLLELSKNFNSKKSSKSPFENTGVMLNNKITTINTTPVYNGPFTVLGDIILLNGAVPKEYYIDKMSIDKWKYLKGAKSEIRVNKENGIKYQYSEGSMVFPDPLDKPSRTIITGEGGPSPSRFKHVIKTADGKLRRLTPLELERLNMFPDDHTKGASDVKRAFFMGNALVVGIIERIGKNLIDRIL